MTKTEVTKTEILARIADMDQPDRPHSVFGDVETMHCRYDEVVADVLTYIANDGVDPAEIAAAMLQHDSPLNWGWYA